MTRFSRALIVLVMLGALVVGVPGVALARVSEYQVQFAPIGDTNTMQVIVNVILSQETTLPATVQVPLPAGATILWAGEILGGDPSADLAREVTVTTTPEGQVVTFTLQEKRVAQVEASLAAAQVSGTKVTAPLSWINTTEDGTYTFSVALEAGAGDVKITPAPGGDPLSNEAGETLYTLTPVRLTKGQPFEINVVYKRGAGSAGSTGGGANIPLLVAIGALAVAVIALVAVLARQRMITADATVPQPPGKPVGASRRDAGPTAEEKPADTPDDGDFFSFD
ncbi:MAG: hypothetical protein WBI63_01440 [Coriobacteriia bacterium]